MIRSGVASLIQLYNAKLAEYVTTTNTVNTAFYNWVTKEVQNEQILKTKYQSCFVISETNESEKPQKNSIL